MKYRVRYYAGPHSGSIDLDAENEEHAKALAGAQVQRELSANCNCRAAIYALATALDDDGPRCIACGHAHRLHCDGCAECGCSPFVGPGFEVAP